MEAATANPQPEPVEAQEAGRSVPPLLIVGLIPFITAALLKPRFLDANENPGELHLKLEDFWTIAIGLILWALIVAFTAAIVLTLVQGNLLNFEKVVFVSICLKISLIAMIVCNHQHFIVAQLDLIEKDMWDARDQISLILQGVKSLLHRANDRVAGLTSEETDKGKDLLKTIGPLAMMFLSKERSMLKWGMAAASLFQKGMSYLGARQNRNQN
jgi:hypothetical protein